MKIYKVEESYIDYLRKFEPKVLENKQEKRPYLGVALQVNSYEYFVPLSSPKPKHKTMKNTIKTKTNNIYDLFNTPDDKLTPSDIRVKSRCCNFKLLEKLCDTYIN